MRSLNAAACENDRWPQDKKRGSNSSARTGFVTLLEKFNNKEMPSVLNTIVNFVSKMMNLMLCHPAYIIP